MINLDYVYRGTCCVCCGIPQISPKHFQTFNGKLVTHTLDHDVLRSLGGSNTVDNLNSMCYDCNQLRGNLFAELSEFLDWYQSGEELPKEKNFSYLYENPNKPRKVVGARYFTFGPAPEVKETKVKTVSPKQESVLIEFVMIDGVKHGKYKHPLFGTSLVKIKD